jgi:hypothetical protein
MAVLERSGRGDEVRQGEVRQACGQAHILIDALLPHAT